MYITPFIELALLYLAVFVMFSICYVGSFHSSLFGGTDVLFYRGIFLLITCTFAGFLLLLLVAQMGYGHIESLMAALLTSASVHLSLFVVFPVTFDRSVTMYLLETLESHQRQMNVQDMENAFIQDYVRDRRAIPRRVHEQAQISMMIPHDNSVELSSRGVDFLKFSRIISRLYGLDTDIIP